MNTKALFIGPYGENQQEFQKWVERILEDLIQWRRNYHPNDPNLISYDEKVEKSYINTLSAIDTSLEETLAELKQSLPYHSPRYLGHMLSVLSMPAVLGYFAGILYNQNNVVGEVSPITTRLELEFMSKVCEMIGYAPLALKYNNKPASYGHLTSGGSTAILEGLWLAKNLKYYPLSLKLFLKEEKFRGILIDIFITLPDGSKTTLGDTSYSDLFNLKPEEVLNIIDRINKALKTDENIKEFQEKIEDYLVQSKGIFGIHSEIDEKLALPKLYVSQTSHYSWKKNMDILGFGKESVVQIKSDKNFKLDIEDLKKKINKNKDNPILAVIAIAGTTEEGAIDPITKLIELKKDIEKKINKSFYFKVDAAWGGYFSSIFRKNENDLPYLDSIKEDILNISQADSVVIDPHKQGFIPYAVGSVSYKDTRYKDFIYKGAPYLATSKVGIDPIEQTYLGGWVLEGSRSGAAAVACAMSARAVPLNFDGYGKLIYNGIENCKEFYGKLLQFNNQNLDFKIKPIYEPQTNVACYILTSPEYIKEAKYLNKLNLAVYNAMSMHPKNPIQNYNFFISKTDLSYKNYREVLKEVLSPIKDINDDFELSFLRSVFMNPNIKNYKINSWEDNQNKKVGLLDKFLNEIKDIGKNALPSILLDILKDKNNGKRLKILWIENKNSFEGIKSQIEQNTIKGIPSIGHFLDIDFDNYQGDNPKKRIKNKVKRENYDFILFDLNLADHHHKEWNSGISLIQDIYKEKVDSKAIIYSQFLVTENMKSSFIRMSKALFPNVFKYNYQFIAKKENKSQVTLESLSEIIKTIFKLCQK